MRTLALTATLFALLILAGCSSEGQPSKTAAPANTAPPAPTSAPIPNLNASDLQKGRRPDQNRDAPPNNSTAAPPKSNETHSNTNSSSSKGGTQEPSASDNASGNK